MKIYNFDLHSLLTLQVSLRYKRVITWWHNIASNTMGYNWWHFRYDNGLKPVEEHAYIQNVTVFKDKEILGASIVIVIKHFYSATQKQKRSQLGPVSSLVKRGFQALAELFKRNRK